MKNKGITLIALVITIIVLLILAGVTIQTLTGDNGLIAKANDAKNATEKSTLREEIELLLLQVQSGDKIEDVFKDGTVTKDGMVYKVAYKDNNFLVSSNYEYIEIVDANIDEWTFNTNTGTLATYKGDLTTKRGNQEIGEVIIPNYYNGKRVKELGNNLFYNNAQKQYLTKISIPNGIEKINGRSFYGL